MLLSDTFAWWCRKVAYLRYRLSFTSDVSADYMTLFLLRIIELLRELVVAGKLSVNEKKFTKKEATSSSSESESNQSSDVLSLGRRKIVTKKKGSSPRLRLNKDVGDKLRKLAKHKTVSKEVCHEVILSLLEPLVKYCSDDDSVALVATHLDTLLER